MHRTCSFGSFLPLARALALAAIALALGSSRTDGAAKPEKASVRVDKLLQDELGTALATDAAAATADEAFLRRLWLDFLGQLPSPETITLFTLDPSPDKRDRAIDDVIAQPAFGENWGRYWRDVFLYRRNDERALLAHDSGARYLAEQFNAGAHWNDVVRDLITAQGLLAENGATVLLASQWGETSDTAAEVSRTLLGVQLQCAQCHDHPTDHWKREEFHEFAAFFPRVNVRAVFKEDKKRRGFEIFSTDPRTAAKKPPKGKNRAEHFMPDMDDPSATGTLMQPVFFATKQKADAGLKDIDRRNQLADWVTDGQNPWFAKAFVNRTWAELVGRGFYEPVDDLGPQRPCAAPKTLSYLSAEFVRNDYDVKWLFRTIASTQAYQQQYKFPAAEGQTEAEANCPQRLRSDQLFNALMAALGLEDTVPRGDGRSAIQNIRSRRTPRAAFQAVFGYDPSTPRDELGASVEQALVLMNAPQIHALIDSSNKSAVLHEMLASQTDDRQLIVELYLRCLAREPKPAEMDTCLAYLQEVGDRQEAYEDLLWSLVNSTEFLYRK
jgi:hypothetical protein